MDKLEQLCRELEHFETDKWAIDVILKHVTLCTHVDDPCTGTGILAQAAKDAGHKVTAADIHSWGYPGTRIEDYLMRKEKYKFSTTVLINPPFSYACDFVEKAFDLGAEQVLCFQRKAWRESRKRREFWRKYPPKRMYVCGERATCWRHDIPVDEDGNRYKLVEDKETGELVKKIMSNTPTPHAWFEFVKGNTDTPVEHIIYKDGGIV